MLRILALLILLFAPQAIPAEYKFYHAGSPADLEYETFPQEPSLRFEVGSVFGRYIGIKENYGQIGLFYLPAPYYSCFQPFMDLKGYFPKKRHWGGSFGMGLRYLDQTNSVWGANFYFDIRDSKRGPFNRLGAGLEYLTPCWEFRVNGYFPIEDRRRSRPHCFNSFIGDFFAVCRESDFIYTGFDSEAGYRLRFDCWSLYGGGGLYYYNNHDRHSFCGGMAHISADWNTYVTLEARASYDHVYHGRVQGQITVSIPLEDLFSCQIWCKCGCLDLLRRPVERNGFIFVDDTCCWKWNWDDSICPCR